MKFPNWIVSTLLFPIIANAAPIGILVEKESELYSTPVIGIKNVIRDNYMVLNMADNVDTGRAHCREFIRKECRVVIAVGKNAAVIATEELAGIPVVYCMVMHPEQSGLKGNFVTGVSLRVPVVKQLEAFKSVIPKLRRVGMLYSENTGSTILGELKNASDSNNISLIKRKVATDRDLPGAVRELKGDVDGLYLPPDRLILNYDAFQFIALFAFENNIPFMAPTDRFVKRGALIALMIDYEEIGRQAGEMAIKIISGIAVQAIPTEPPRITMLVLNQKTAQTIGINIPPTLLLESKIIR